MTSRPSAMAQEPQTLSSFGDMHLQVVGTSRSRDWLPDMIFAARTIATGAEFVPLPCVRGAFAAVVIFLETVEKIQRNREDLKDLCASTLEIILIVREEIKARGETATIPFTTLLENFISFLQFLQIGLERLLQRRPGFRSRFQEIFCAARISEEIRRYRTRINELRSNFLLMTTINTNLNVIGMQNNMVTPHSPVRRTDFRDVALGDINLLYEAPMGSKLHKIKMFVARISGEQSTMTVAKYEGGNDRWRRDLEVYSNLRHPNVWQLFGISTAPALRALIFYEEPIPLPVYRQFHRPQSDFLWVCVETMLFGQFKSRHVPNTIAGALETADPEATICVRRDPIGICLTLPDLELELNVDQREDRLSRWHWSCFGHQSAPTNTQQMAKIIGTPLKELSQYLNWSQFFAVFTPAWLAGVFQWTGQTQPFLGSVIKSHTTPPIAYIPNYSAVLRKEWTLGPPEKSIPGDLYARENDPVWQQFVFPPGSFKAADMTNEPLLMSSYFEFDTVNAAIVDTGWLAQANACLGPTIAKGKHGYGAINTLGWAVASDHRFKATLHPEGTTRAVHLSIAPITAKYEGARVRADFDYLQSDSFYWSLDPGGIPRLSTEECDSLGLPRLRFIFLLAGNFWHEYHYSAVREFLRVKGLDPYGHDLPHLLGLPLVEKEPFDSSVAHRE
ncbi:hypothetical protein B0H14DRAFT_3872387 [Mycena olivaceomarginata]|nr:hypothetical protein B0H14DRAFT_3872387 [Mycena olivaceomarginata]